jgi:diguanylate cyclase (GGDEF)-like protein/PAS domain S-box-containing protein
VNQATTTTAGGAPAIRLPRADLAIVAGVLVFVLGQWVLAEESEPLYWWTDLAWTLVSGLAALSAFAAARRLGPAAGRAWWLIGAGNLAWAGGMLIWSYREVIVGEATPFPGAADVGFLLWAPLVSLGLVLYQGRPRGVSFTLMELSQLGIFVSGILLAHVILLFERIASLPGETLYLATALAYPVLYMTVMVQAVSLLSAWRSVAGRRALIWLCAGVATLAVVNSAYAYALLGDDYAVGHALDAGWVLGFALMARAGLAQVQDRPAGGEREPDQADGIPRALRVGALIPAVTLLATLVVLLLSRDQLSGAMLDYALFPALLLVGFLALREWSSNGVRDLLYTRVRESQERFRRFFEASPASIGINRLRDGRFVDVNAAFEALTGWTRAEVIGRRADELGLWVDNRDRAGLVQRLGREGGRLRALEMSICDRSGARHVVFGSIEIIHFEGEDYVVAVVIDITGTRQAESEMRKLSSALEQTADAVMITDAQGRIEHVNPAFETITGYGYHEVIGALPSLLKSGEQDAEFYHQLWSRLRAGEGFSGVFINRRRDGTLYYAEQTISPLKDGAGRITHYVAVSRDISDRIQSEERLRELAHQDALTHLPNRALFVERLGEALVRARWTGRGVAVLFMDLDRFKDINDSLGHDAGDRLLCLVAERLRGGLRETDLVARFGGDEFVVLVDELADGVRVERIAEKLLAALQPPFELGEARLRVTASIGTSLYPADGDDPGVLVKNADIAMYRAKERGRNTYQRFRPEMGEHIVQRLALESRLREAVEREQLDLHYQPQLDARSGQIVGVEALLRWEHPELGPVHPSTFVPLLEDTGLIVPVGNWVLRRAAAQLAAWDQAGWLVPSLSINLSSRQFSDPGLAPEIERALADTGLDPRRIEIEITESTLMRHGSPTEPTLARLSELGVRIAVDDFGTGYSSLGYLRRLAVDTLKIDRSFVADLPGNEDDAAIVSAIIGLGTSLRLRLVAEGVETEPQRDFLLAQGCHRMQGFLFGRAVPASELGQRLARAEPAPVAGSVVGESRSTMP